MDSHTFTYMKTGDCWRMDESEVFVHLPFLKNSSEKYLKRVFRTDFNLNLDEKNLQNLRNPKSSPITIYKFEN